MQQLRTTARLIGVLVGASALGVTATAANAQDSSGQAQTAQPDSQAKPDSLWGYKVDTTAPRNPAGYRGMERPTNILPADSQASTRDQSPEAVKGRVTGAYSDSSWQDSSSATQNAQDSRGRARPAGQDTSGAAEGAGAPDTTKVGDTTPRTPKKASDRLHPGSDTAQKADVTGADTDADTAGDSTGMSGRHGSDSTNPGDDASENGQNADSGR